MGVMTDLGADLSQIGTSTIAELYTNSPLSTWAGTEKIPVDSSGTAKSGLASTLRTYIVQSIAEAIKIQPSAAADKFDIFGRSGLAFPVPYLTPTQNNTAIAFDIFPKGTPSDAGGGIGVAWFDLCATDIAASGSNYEALRLAVKAPAAGSYFTIGAAASGTGTIRDIVMQPDGGILCFVGHTSAYPALKRSATVLQARLADDSAFAPLQGLLRTAANAVSETITPTHTLVITDASGQAYRVPCQV